MLDDEEEFLPPKPEVVPERLAKKWEARESQEKLIVCGSCSKQVLASSSVCVYCGMRLQHGRPVWVVIAAALLVLFSILFFLRRLV